MSTTRVSFQQLAAVQRQFDRRGARRLPVAFLLKRQKMLQSPHAFLRGSAPLFYELLRQRPDLRSPLPGRGWIDGDMHLENFGAFRTDEAGVVFDLNDFDEAIPAGAWSDDLLRLSVSCFLSGEFGGLAGVHVVDLVETLLEAHSRAAFSKFAPRPPALPRPIAFLLERAEKRTKRHMLDVRVPFRGGKRRFRLGTKYLPLAASTKEALPQLLRRYAAQLGDACPAHLQDFELEDAAQRIAGTGSLGVTRIAALVRSGNRQFLYDIKEARPAASLRAESGATQALASLGVRTDAERVVAGAGAMLAATPRRLQALWSEKLKLSFVARQFTPSEDKLDLETLQPGELPKIVTTLGHLLGRAHRRGASNVPRRTWSDSARRKLVRRAGELATLIDGAYLASAFLEHGAGRASTQRGSSTARHGGAAKGT